MFCLCLNVFFFFKQKTAYEMRISDWSSDVCSSDLFTGEDKMPSKSREDFSRLLMAPLIAAALLVAAAPANAQQNPGVFVHAADDEPTTLGPAQVEPGEGGETVILQVYERLLEFAPTGPELIPALATEVPTLENGLISEDGLTYTFPIRQGVKFHDGSDLTAQDVKFSWDRVMTMDLPEGAADTLIDIVAETEVADDHTFRVMLKRPSASFLNGVVVAMVSSIVSQDAVEANGGVAAGQPNQFMAGNMVGTGPYRFTRSEEHTSELQSLMRISYAVFRLKKKKKNTKQTQKQAMYT